MKQPRNDVRLLLVLSPALACWVGAVLLLFIGVRQLYLAWEATPEPEPLTVAELIGRGPSGNPNIVVRDFEVGKWHGEERRRDSDSLVYVVLVIPRPGVEASSAPAPIQEAVVLIDEGPNAQRVRDKVAALDEIPCTVMNRLGWLPPAVRTDLNMGYPDVEFDRVVLLRRGTVYSRQTIWALIAASIVLLLGAVTLTVLFVRICKARNGKRSFTSRPPQARPVKLKYKHHKSNRLALRILPVIGCVLAGSCLTFFGGLELHLYWNSSSEPESYTLADLLARGPEGNRHVVIREFHLAPVSLMRKGDKADLGDDLLVVLRPGTKDPAGLEDRRAKEFALLREAGDARKVLAELQGARELTCVVMNGQTKLLRPESERLQALYPEADLDRILVLSRRTYTPRWIAWMLFGSGIGLLALGGFFGWWTWREARAQQTAAYDVDEALGAAREGHRTNLPLPEDEILFKLRSFRQGGDRSDEIWTEILNHLRTHAGRLDDAYLDRWAADLQVTDLLQRARRQSRLIC